MSRDFGALRLAPFQASAHSSFFWESADTCLSVTALAAEPNGLGFCPTPPLTLCVTSDRACGCPTPMRGPLLQHPLPAALRSLQSLNDRGWKWPPLPVSPPPADPEEMLP